MELLGENKCFGGRQLRCSHRSAVLDCEMTFSIFLPPQAAAGSVPVVYWLSGLTCTDVNFVTKAGAQRYAAELGLALVAPETSPRGEDVPDDPAGAYDFGLGAGFYLNATEQPWQHHYRMYDYIRDELPRLIEQAFPVDASRVGISGHSMGGHGALVLALRNPGRFGSVTAFAPICSPMNCPWGEKALGGYLGPDRETWRQYDSTVLLAASGERLPVLVDQGDADNFLAEQLQIHLLEQASAAAGYPMTIRLQPGYDHSYFFIASFIGEHLAFHDQHLR